MRLDLVEELAAKMAGVRAGQMAQMTTEIPWWHDSSWQQDRGKTKRK